ncbi:MAG: zinc ribbon domain-containing protein [Acidimicrobiales bacterium]
MTLLERLLALQDLDLAMDQLRRRIATLPERAAADAALADADRRRAEQGQREAQRHELEREQKRLEDEAATLAARAKDADRTLYSGSVTATRELMALKDEVDSLRRRQGALEDKALEVMEQVEPLTEALRSLGEQRTEAESRAAAALAALAEREAALTLELDALAGRRAAAAGDVAPGALAEYDSARAQHGGVAIARLVGNRCEGCHLQLSAVDLDHIRRLPPDSVARCEECGRILVRAAPGSAAASAG